jgi:hypothetical protein
MTFSQQNDTAGTQSFDSHNPYATACIIVIHDSAQIGSRPGK